MRPEKLKQGEIQPCKGQIAPHQRRVPAPQLPGPMLEPSDHLRHGALCILPALAGVHVGDLRVLLEDFGGRHHEAGDHFCGRGRDGVDDGLREGVCEGEGVVVWVVVVP